MVSNVTESRPTCPECLWESWGIQGLLASIICVIGITGNLMVLYVMKKIKDNTPAGLLIKTLASSDFTYVFLQFVSSAFPALIFKKDFSLANYTWLYLVISPIALTAFCVTSCVTVLLAFHRYTAVSRAKVLATGSTLRKIKIQIAVAVVLSIVLNIPRAFEYTVYDNNNTCFWKYNDNNNTCFRKFNPKEFITLQKFKNYYLYYYIIVYCSVFNKLPIIMLPFFTTKLVICLRRLHSRTMARLNMAQRQRTSMEKKITVLCVSISIIFVLCNIPGMIFRHVYYYQGMDNFKSCSHLHVTSMVSSVLFMVNSSGIFFIYMKLSKKFRKVVLDIPKKLFNRKENEGLQWPMRSDSNSGQSKLVIYARDDNINITWPENKSDTVSNKGGKVKQMEDSGVNFTEISLEERENSDKGREKIGSSLERHHGSRKY